ncbi:MAG: thermonuclease family protein [Desulfobulbus sp.]|nr:thermonuclease family protein [Desulfobulbus sp.]
MQFRIQLPLLLLLVFILFPALAVAQAVTAKVIRVIDGDTIKVNLQGQTESVRLIGIDTPECRANQKAERDSERSGQDLAAIISQGKEATSFTRSRVKKGDTVRLETDVQQRDKYRRLLAYVWLPNGTMLNEAIVRAGYAQPATFPPNVKYQDLFQEAAREARKQRRGLWE